MVSSAKELWKRCAWLKKHAREDCVEEQRKVNRCLFALVRYLGGGALMAGCAMGIATMGFSTLIQRGDWYPMMGFVFAFGLF